MKGTVKFKQYDEYNRDSEFILELTSEATDAFSKAPVIVYSSAMNFSCDDTIVLFKHKNEAFSAGVKLEFLVLTSIPTHNIISEKLFTALSLDSEASGFKDIGYTTTTFNTMSMRELTNGATGNSPFTIGFRFSGADETTVKRAIIKIGVSRYRNATNSIVVK